MVKKKIVAQTQNDDWIPKKVRKKRKPMTPEQRIAAAERLERARAAKAPAKNQTIHQNVISLPDEHYLSAKKVKSWIKSNNITNAIFLFAASTLSNYIIHECYKECSDNTYLDIGSSISPWMNLEGWKYTRAYLQHWILGMPNKYGTQEDVWS